MAIKLDPKLVQEVPELTGEPTKTSAINKALRDFIARRHQRKLLDLVGKLDWDPG